MDDTPDEEKAEYLADDLGQDFMDLFRDDNITELGLNPFDDHVWVDTHSEGKVSTDVPLPDSSVYQFLNRLATYEDTLITDESPDIECSLPVPIFDGGRLTGNLPPTVPSPTFCLRKFEGEIIPLESYVEDKIISQRQYDAIIDAIKHYKNVAVVGGTGSGKTTLLMSILNRMGKLFEDRFVTIEDTPELTLETAWNWLPLYTFDSDDDYAGTIKDRVHRSLRLSPDRLIVGECRGPGIVALFEGLLSGHPGGAFTYHATSISQFLKRVLINCKRESDTDAHMHTIGDAIDVIIILEKAMGVRYVKQMAHMKGYDSSSHEYVYERIWRDPDHHPDKFIPDEVRRGREEITQ